MRFMLAIILGISAASIGTAQAQYYQPPPPSYQVPNYQPPPSSNPYADRNPFGRYGNPSNLGNQLQRPSRSYDSEEGILATARAIKTIQEKAQAVTSQPSVVGCGADERR